MHCLPDLGKFTNRIPGPPGGCERPDRPRNDQPGDTRPYLYDGEIHRNVQSQQQVREPLRERAETGQGVGQERREHHSELRQAIRKDLQDRVEAVQAGVGQLKERIAERQAERETPSE